jgi:hypothetical protein
MIYVSQQVCNLALDFITQATESGLPILVAALYAAAWLLGSRVRCLSLAFISLCCPVHVRTVILGRRLLNIFPCTY